MSRYRVHFKAIQYSKTGNSTGTINTSVMVEAESEQTAILLATNKMTSNSTYKGREIVATKIEKLK